MRLRPEARTHPDRKMEAERVRQAVVNVEEHADLDRILHGVIAHTGGAQWFHVRRSHVRWGERELLEEAEGRTQLGIERSGAPISQDCLDQGVVFLFLLQGQRRDRAVSAGSEQALVQAAT